MLKKAIVLLISAVLVFCTVSCAKSGSIDVVETHTDIITTTVQQLGSGTIHLAYNPNDSLDPYTAKSKLNRQLTSLLFEPLVKLDSELNPQLCIARSVESSGKNCTVELRDISFSDGSSVTAEDVANSFDLASSAKTTVYYSQLSNIKSCSASGNSVVFSLEKADVNCINLLDFPIIKSGTQNRTNEDKKALPPIGCGRYVYEYSNGDYSFKPNKSYFNSVPKNNIKLFRVPDDEAWTYSVRSGETDIYYSGDNTSNLPSFSGGASTVRHTDFVFLSVSEQSQPFQNTNLRRAVYYIINRQQITESAFYKYANPAISPYPSTVSFAKSTSTGLSPTGNVDTALDFMSRAGYTNRNEQGYFLDKSGKPLSLKLLCNTKYKEHTVSAEALVQQLRKIGIMLELVQLDNTSYRTRIQSGEYDLLLAEIKLNKNFDLTPVFQLDAPISVTTTTTTAKSDDDDDYDDEQNTTTKAVTTTKPKINNNLLQKVTNAYGKYVSGELGISGFADVYFENLPFIPICHRTGVTGYSSAITSTAVSSISDAYINIEYLQAK